MDITSMHEVLADNLKRHPLDASQLGIYSCENCPLGAKTYEKYENIDNDTSEATYACPALNKPVWGEDPECAEHFTNILLTAAKLGGFEKFKLRQSLSPEETGLGPVPLDARS